MNWCCKHNRHSTIQICVSEVILLSFLDCNRHSMIKIHVSKMILLSFLDCHDRERKGSKHLNTSAENNKNNTNTELWPHQSVQPVKYTCFSLETKHFLFRSATALLTSLASLWTPQIYVWTVEVVCILHNGKTNICLPRSQPDQNLGTKVNACILGDTSYAQAESFL